MRRSEVATQVGECGRPVVNWGSYNKRPRDLTWRPTRSSMPSGSYAHRPDGSGAWAWLSSTVCGEVDGVPLTPPSSAPNVEPTPPSNRHRGDLASPRIVPGTSSPRTIRRTDCCRTWDRSEPSGLPFCDPVPTLQLATSPPGVARPHRRGPDDPCSACEYHATHVARLHGSARSDVRASTEPAAPASRRRAATSPGRGWPGSRYRRRRRHRRWPTAART